MTVVVVIKLAVCDVTGTQAQRGYSAIIVRPAVGNNAARGTAGAHGL